MVGKYRSKIDISVTILRLSIERTKLTRVMFEGHLSWEQLKSYVRYLHENHLIMVSKDIPIEIQITQKGIQFLKNYEELEKVMPLMLKT